jgi:hypothetical protein
MKNERNWESGNAEFLELQIEKMIDDLFVSREEGQETQNAVSCAPAAESADVVARGSGSRKPTVRSEIEIPSPAAQEASHYTKEAPPSVEEDLIFDFSAEMRLPEMIPEHVQQEKGHPLTSRIETKTPDVSQVGLELFPESDNEGIQSVFESAMSEGKLATHPIPHVSNDGSTTRERQNEYFQPKSDAAEPAMAVAGSVIPARDKTSLHLYDSLKENILSLEWEISPQNITSFQGLMQQLHKHMANNAMGTKCSVMMNNVLSYIKKVGRSAIPLSIQFLQTGVDFLGALLVPEEMPDANSRKELFPKMVEQYKLLKFQIDRQKEKSRGVKQKLSSPPSPGTISPELAEYIKTAAENAAQAIIEKVLHDHLEKFRSEVMALIAKQPSSADAAVPIAGQEDIERARAAEKEEVKTTQQVLTVSMGDRSFNIPEHYVANTYSVSKRTLAKLMRTRAFHIKDLLPLFSTATTGMRGPLAAAKPSELKRQQLLLVDTVQTFHTPQLTSPTELVLVSDGNISYGFLADAIQWRSVEIPPEFVQIVLGRKDSSHDLFDFSPAEHPFLNVAKLLQESPTDMALIPSGM